MDDETRALHLAAGRAYGRQATCGVKVNYGTEMSAEKAAAAMNVMGKARKPLEGYPCAWCGGWHIGRAMSLPELQQAARVGEVGRTQDDNDSRP